jgi:hypothetical protein
MQGYQKMIIKGGDGTVVRGHWKADDEAATVLSAYGQLKTMDLEGSTPRGLARLMLLLMEEERGHPVPLTPEEIEEGKRNIELTIAENRFNKLTDYAARGRRFSALSHAELLRLWTAAHDKLGNGPANDLVQDALATDLDAESKCAEWSHRTKSMLNVDGLSDLRQIKQNVKS